MRTLLCSVPHSENRGGAASWRMSKPSPQMHTLSLALRACGGEAPLAKALGVSADAMSEWLAGRGALPAAVYLKARALVSGKR